MGKIKVVIADDQVLFAGSLKTVLEGNSDDIRVVGIAYNGEEAVEQVEAVMPDIVLMDVRMPVLDGIEATRIICERFPQIRVMMLTTYDDDELVHNALYAGAVGYILKNMKPEEIINAIRVVREGSFLMSPKVGEKIALDLHDADEKIRDRAAEINRLLSIFEHLTKREGEILDLLLQGCANRLIADRLFVSEQTVKNHLSVIYEKLGVKNRTQAVINVKNLLLNSASSE